MGLRVEGGDHFVALIRVGLNSDGKGRDEINTKSSLKILGKIPPFVNPSTRLAFPGLQNERFCSFSFLDGQTLVLWEGG